MTTRPPYSLLANVVNDVMIASPPPAAYARKMAAVTPRKLWQAQPGDCVVTLAPCPTYFRDYVESITEVPAGSVDLVAPDRLVLGHACQVIDDLGATDQVAARGTLAPFVADEPAVAFARRTRMSVHPYDVLPGRPTLDAIRTINTKAGFREVAVGLELPVAAGGHAATASALISALTEFLRTRPRAIVKLNRSSNGYATFVVEAALPVPDQVRAALAGQSFYSCGWVYEEFLTFTSVPSVELVVEEGGVRDFYVCDQRTRDNAWTGMVTPPDQPVPAAVLDSAVRVGEWLAARGYRGYFDVDAGLVAGSFVVTEANVRRTGGTYLEELARALVPGAVPYWCADVRRGSARCDFRQAVQTLDKAGLSAPDAPARVVLPVDTLDVDGRWRYLVVGRTARDVTAAEEQLARILELS